MGTVAFKLREVLTTHNLKPREVETEAIRQGYRLGRNTVYRLLADDGPANYNRDTLAALVGALRALTKRRTFGVADLLEYRED